MSRAASPKWVRKDPETESWELVLESGLRLLVTPSTRYQDASYVQVLGREAKRGTYQTVDEAKAQAEALALKILLRDIQHVAGLSLAELVCLAAIKEGGSDEPRTA